MNKRSSKEIGEDKAGRRLRRMEKGKENDKGDVKAKKEEVLAGLLRRKKHRKRRTVAKNPFRLKTRITNLKDEDRVRAFVRRNFIWEDKREEGEGPRATGRSPLREEKKMECIGKFEKPLPKAKSTSTPGPDGIGYRLLKRIKQTPLGIKLMEQIADTLHTQQVRTACREMVVILCM